MDNGFDFSLQEAFLGKLDVIEAIYVNPPPPPLPSPLPPNRRALPQRKMCIFSNNGFSLKFFHFFSPAFFLCNGSTVKCGLSSVKSHPRNVAMLVIW